MEGSPLYSVLWGLDPTYVLASQADRGLIFGGKHISNLDFNRLRKGEHQVLNYFTVSKSFEIHTEPKESENFGNCADANLLTLCMREASKIISLWDYAN